MYPPSASSVIGQARTRIDGPLKVTGQATYAAEHAFPGLLNAVPVGATIGSGRLLSLDTAEASGMPGVRAILTHGNIGPLYRADPATGVPESRPPLDDNEIRYYGQYIALVVADTFEQATAAANRVRAQYRENPPDVRKRLQPDQPTVIDTQRGDADRAFSAAPVKVDQGYTTPVETHNPMELHATVALYDAGRCTIYEGSQGVVDCRTIISQMLGIPPENVQVISRYVGGGFGGKTHPWPHSVLAVAASRQLRRPVKLVVSRKMMFQNVGHRPNTQQRIRLGAGRDGRLHALRHDFLYHCPRLDSYRENCGEATGYHYSTPNLKVTSGFARRDVGVTNPMRGPGAVPGLFAVESAMDELAIALNMDPVDLRLINEPRIDEMLQIPFSSRHLSECLVTGAARFGWNRRDPRPGSMRKDGLTLGWGMAGGSWLAVRFPARATVTFRADGKVRVASATQDIGTGTYTVMAQMVAAISGVSLDRIEVELGDTRLPAGPSSFGSMATASLVPAVAAATRDALRQLRNLAGTAAAPQAFDRSGPALSTEPGSRDKAAMPFEQLLSQRRLGQVVGYGESLDTIAPGTQSPWSFHSYIAHFVEVTWQWETARLRINRVVSVVDGGRVLNALTGRSQIEGAIMMGIGMALFEQTHYDSRNGAPINSSLADYVMTTHADAPSIETVFLDYPDMALNELGARGIGEIGMAGFAAAVTAAVYHATGVRVRDLPVSIEDLLGARAG